MAMSAAERGDETLFNTNLAFDSGAWLIQGYQDDAMLMIIPLIIKNNTSTKKLRFLFLCFSST